MEQPGRLLTEYVTGVAMRVIGDKTTAGKAPAVCTLDELTQVFRTDAVEAMRELCRSGKFRGHVSVNKTPMIELK